MKRVSDRGLACLGLSCKFGSVAALQNFSYEFPRSGTIGIIGPNGAGKSTLLNVISGFATPSSGSVHLGDDDVLAIAPHMRARLGIGRTFQDLRVIEGMKAWENVALAARDRTADSGLWALSGLGFENEERRLRGVADEALAAVNLDGVADEYAGELSYGQKKALTLAMAVTRSTRLLMLDEPVSGIDPGRAGGILACIERVAASGAAIVFVEHDLQAVRDVAQTVLFMDAGRLRASGSPSEVLESDEVLHAYLRC